MMKPTLVMLHLQQDRKKKIGKKKMEKLQRKQEDKEARKAWLEEQEERKKERELKQQEMLEEESKLKEERELTKKQELEELERQRIENEKKQAAIYEQWKDLIQIDAAGSNSIDQGNEEETTKNFIQYVQKQKIVNLEELAAEFRLKTQDIIDKLKDLEKKDRITGVFDDRGKYIYISLDELKAVAKYMNQMGRVSIVELEYVKLVINIQISTDLFTLSVTSWGCGCCSWASGCSKSLCKYIFSTYC